LKKNKKKKKKKKRQPFSEDLIVIFPLLLRCMFVLSAQALLNIHAYKHKQNKHKQEKRL